MDALLARRQLIRASACAALVLPVIAGAQSLNAPRRVFVIMSGLPETNGHYMAAFADAMRLLGWAEGKNLVLEVRWAAGRYEAFERFAAEALAGNADLVVAPTTPAVRSAQRLIKGIPIVFAVCLDPVGDGLVASLDRPGANTTGTSTLSAVLMGKRLELLKECVPSIKSVAVLNDIGARYNPGVLGRVLDAARVLGIRLSVFDVTATGDFDLAFAAIKQQQLDGLFVMDGPFLARSQTDIVARTTSARLPAVYPIDSYAENGGLMVYGVSYPNQYRRAADYVDRILKGARPSDLPVEQPTTFELIVNLKAARALPLTIPRIVLLRANRIIE